MIFKGDENGKVKHGGGWLTTKYYIQVVQKKVHTFVQQDIAFQEILTPDLDGMAFKIGNADNFWKILIFILKMFELDHIARDSTQPPVQLAYTVDGANILWYVLHVTARIKILDPSAINPISHLPIGLEGSKKVQSCDLCFLFKMILTQDTVPRTVQGFFNFFSQLNNQGLLELGIQPIMVSSPQDMMSSMWKALGRGDSCKVKTFFCYCCAVTSKESAIPWKVCCPSCVRKEWLKCYHSDTGDAETLQRLHANLHHMKITPQFLQFEDTSGVLAKLQSHLDPSQFATEKDPSLTIRRRPPLP